jgi:acyl-CoA synthetase (NDP forming)
MVRSVRQQCEAILDRGSTEAEWLGVPEARSLLDSYGLALLGEVVTGAESAAATAARLGFPVAVKLANAGGLHKTEKRLVRTGLDSAEEVRRAVADFDFHAAAEPEVLVQPMASGVEMALGVARDPTLGPLVMVAAGGVATDVWDDRVFLLPPVSLADAQRAVRGLRIWPLLQGFRGTRPADAASLEALIVDLARLAVDVPEVAELDLNPVMVAPGGCSLVDVRLRLTRTDDPGAGTPRQLRRVE